nr:retrovirus-related Pol polyprotein from transposon TNT 1-94 [Tanacetum cinerariifolium]
MAAGQRKLEAQWTADERKVANLDQHLKSLIMLVLLDDQMNSVINCLTEKSTWDDLILYHEGPSNVKEIRVIDLKLCYNTFKFKEDSTLPNHDTDEVPSNKSQRNTIDPSAVVSDSSAHDYDPADESLVCSTPLLPLKKLDGVEPGSGPKAVKSVLKSKIHV